MTDAKLPRDEIDSALLTRNVKTGETLMPITQPGYYPGFSTLSQQNFWDEATRDLVVTRVERTPNIRHFTQQEALFWRAVFDHLIPQHDRVQERRIPIVEPLDERLYRGKTAGYRYENMPPDPDAYRLGQQAIDEEAAQRFGAEFLNLPYKQRDLTLQALHGGKPAAAKEIWKSMSVQRFWQLLMSDALEGYYSHPWAWDEIGFGGPAYPRGYTRLEKGEPEPWEVEEERYEWVAPDYSVSDAAEVTSHLHLESGQNG